MGALGGVEHWKGRAWEGGSIGNLGKHWEVWDYWEGRALGGVECWEIGRGGSIGPSQCSHPGNGTQRRTHAEPANLKWFEYRYNIIQVSYS